MTDAPHPTALLKWQIEAGADEATLDAPQNRFAQTQAPQIHTQKQPPAPTRQPAQTAPETVAARKTPLTPIAAGAGFDLPFQ